jgi:hypothetical protein
MKRLGIKKITPSSQGSKLRNDTNASRYTERSNNTMISSGGTNYHRREQVPTK